MRTLPRSRTALPSDSRLPRLLGIAALVLAAASAGGCARMIRPVDAPTMAFESEAPAIDASIEICVRPKLHKRQWNVHDHPYVIELGKRAAIGFERMVKTAFRDAAAVYTDRCGETSRTPWIEATIVSANRDYDGFEGGLIEQEPVDTALTMSFEIHADDGSEIWTTTVEARHRSVDPAPWNVRTRRHRGSRDFGVVLGEALDEGFTRLITSREVRAAFGDPGLDAPSEDAPGVSPEAEGTDEG